MYLLNQPIRAVICGDNGRYHLDIIPEGAVVRLRGPSKISPMVEIIWRGVSCSVFLTDLEDRSENPMRASA